MRKKFTIEVSDNPHIGGITALTKAAVKNKILMNHVADFADHKDIHTTRGYDEHSAPQRASFSDIIGQSIAEYAADSLH